jgi:hypothetical protein
MLLDHRYNYLNPDVLMPLRDYIKKIGEDLFAVDDEVIYGNRHIQAFNMTFTTDQGWNNLSKIYPGFDGYLEQVVDFNCNMIHIVALRGSLGAEIEPHQDDTLEEHLENNTSNERKGVFLGLDPICSTHTTITYLQVPRDMEGGKFYIQAEEDGEKEYYRPQTNMMLKITGDTWHGATAVTEIDGERFVLVCEQYKLSMRNLRRLSDYDAPKILRG